MENFFIFGVLIMSNIKVVGEYKAIEITEIINGVNHSRVLHPSRIEQEKDGSNQQIIQTDISSETTEIQNVCNTEWTNSVKTAWENKLKGI
jgi:hypothetical protein